MVATWTVLIGGEESAREVSPWESSSQRLWTFLVPGLEPQEERASEGIRGASQSDRERGEEKRRGGDGDGVLDMMVRLGLGFGFLKNRRRGFGTKGKWTGGILRWWWGLEERIRRRERDARNRSGKGEVMIGNGGGEGGEGGDMLLFFRSSSPIPSMKTGKVLRGQAARN